MVIASEKVTRRELSKLKRRQQLIDATIKCIAKRGLSSTTLAGVATEAGLSQGIVNLHFDSKDNLLYETLRYVAEDYDRQFMDTFKGTSDNPATCLLALSELDLQTTICDARKLAVWFAFWSEVKAVPTYRKLCAAREQKYEEIRVDLADRMIRAGDYDNADANLVAIGLGAFTDGFWLSCLVNPKSFDRQVALRIVKSYLRAIFPNHYT